MNDLSGITINGRYHIIEPLGQGGMATVYKALDTLLERTVAIKLIRTQDIPQSQHVEMLKRFKREAKAVGKMTHTHIVKVHDFGEYKGAPYLVMQYLPGGSLKNKIGKPMPYQDAARLLLSVAQALNYAHQHSIVHRDVKPANILIDEDGEVTLSDFGIAKVLEQTETTQLTNTGVGIGTPEYMPPEQWIGKTVLQTDIYALGVILYELITGRKPYSADNPAALFLKAATEPLPRPGMFIPGLPSEVERILIKALAKKPEERFASMAEFAAVLEKMSGVHTHNQVAPLPRSWVKPVIGNVLKADLAFQAEKEPLRAAPPVQAAAPVTASNTSNFPLVRALKNKAGERGRLWTFGGAAFLGVIAITIFLLVIQTNHNIQQRQQYLLEVEETIALANSNEQPAIQRIYWEKALELLDQADAYGITEQSIQLRSDVLAAIDAQDGVSGVEVSRITDGTGLGINANINRIVADGSEFYLLDQTQGKILRMYQKDETYHLDETFECGKGTYQKLVCEESSYGINHCGTESDSTGWVGSPVDMAILPMDNLPQAAILAIDGKGMLMYCNQQSAPVVYPLPHPTQGWEQITSISLVDDILYITDKGNKMVYYSKGTDAYFPVVIQGETGFVMSNIFAYFEGDYVPNFAQVLDMEVNKSEMFLLKDDATMISCVKANSVECSDPAPYHDIRKGNVDEPIPLELNGEIFTQMQITQPPTPAIFLLEASSQKVYQFNWSLNLSGQLRPRGSSDTDLPETTPTALAITPNHVMIIAYGNQVFVGTIP